MKGLSFSEPMVKAWLEGRKTVTRRLMNPQPPDVDSRAGESGPTGEWWIYGHNTGGYFRSRYLPGEVVYIRETCYICGSDCAGAPLSDPPVVYRADGARKCDAYPYVRTPRFMPEWASRSHARIVSVRSERVQEITTEEIIREGFSTTLREHEACCHLQEQFKAIWETLHPGSWDRNDWVWRIELEKLP